MQHAKIFSILIFFLLSIYGAVSFYFLPLASFDGDLTRMSMLPESLFGWTITQPAIDPNLMQQSPIQEADVFVIGDSFSEGLIWQSVLAKHGLKVRTESWKNFEGVICADVTTWLRSRGFVGTYVIIESNERDIVKRMRGSVACTHMPSFPHNSSDIPRLPPITSLSSINGYYSGKLSTRFRMLINVLKYKRIEESDTSKTWALSNNVKMVRIESGCELFSHTQCKDSLFFGEDSPNQVDPNALDDIEILNKWFVGITPIWAFVPNKSSAYLYPDKHFWDDAEQRLLAPNLLNMTQRAIQKKTIDLYPANNTHFSTTGYLLMGEEVLKTMDRSRNRTLQ